MRGKIGYTTADPSFENIVTKAHTALQKLDGNGELFCGRR